jgi:hypothetical protein
VIVQNPPLEQWQIDHIRKMKEELVMPQAASDVEEDKMNTGLGALGTVADIEAEDAADADASGLAVYNDPNVQKAMTAYNKLATEQTARYDALERAIAEKRYAPSFSERMFQLSAALAQPTTRRGFGGVLENITPVLAAQQKAQREGNISRREALDKLDTDRLAQQVGLAKQGLTTSLAMAKIDATAKKSQEPKLVFADGAWRVQPGTGDYPIMPDMDQFGNYIITDRRQLEYLPPNTPVVEVGQDPMKPKYVPDRANPDR